MTVVREPTLKPVNIDELRPTQITVGMREVETKRKRWREKGSKKEVKFLEDHMIPVILGPKERHYIIDHHHLARALHEEGRKDVLVSVVANLSKIDKESFGSFSTTAVGCIPSTSMVGDASTAIFPPLLAISSTILTGASLASCAGSADLPKTRRHSASFFGPISCAVGSGGNWSRKILDTLSRSRWNSRKALTPTTCPDGAGP